MVWLFIFVESIFKFKINLEIVEIPSLKFGLELEKTMIGKA